MMVVVVVYEQVAIEKVHQGEYKAEHGRGRKRERILGAADEADLSPRDRFKFRRI